MIIKITFVDRVMLFGDSYKPWQMQVDEYMFKCADIPSKIEYSRSEWIGWGGLKWCLECNFQQELNREGCQDDEPDNASPRRYADMVFEPAKPGMIKTVMDYYQQGQR